MNQTTQIQQPRNRSSGESTPFVLAAGLLLITLYGSPATAQGIPGCPADLWREPILPRDLATISSSQGGDLPSFLRGNPCRLFRMPTTDPVGLDLDNDTPANEAEAAGGSCQPDSTSDGRLKVAIGSDNPYFDFRRPGDPGGIGYYRLYSQVLVFDNDKTGLSMGFQAVTPAGLEGDGVADGPTILSPHFAWFHEIAGGTAIQGFVGKNLRANSHWSDSLGQQINYGLALQSPLPGIESTPSRSVHMFLEALGRYRMDGDPTQHGNWDLLPGLHWQLNESWWMSGGVLMPLGGTPRLDAHLWQITCSWQF
jgi:hypothetical protein